MQNNEPTPTSMRQMVLDSRYSISKSGIWAIWTSPFCRFLASFPIKYDVTDAMLQDIEKMKVQYLISLLSDLFEIL